MVTHETDAADEPLARTLARGPVPEALVLPLLLTLKRDFDLAPQQDPVGKAGQRVVMRHMGDLLLVALAFADVRKGANEAAVGQIDAAHLEHDAVRPRALVTAQDRR